MFENNTITSQDNTYLFVCFEDIAFEHIGGTVTSNVTEDFQILRVVRHIEDSGTLEKYSRVESLLLEVFFLQVARVQHIDSFIFFLSSLLYLDCLVN